MNPYEVLGVEIGASKEEIHAAYRQKVKKYHPDKFQDESLKKLAEEKLKEINRAYEILTEDKDTQNNAGNYSGQGGSRRQQAYSGPNREYYTHIRNAFARHDYVSAKQILDAVSVRDAEWYYLMGHYFFHQKKFDTARQYYAHAVSLDAGNMEYRQAYESARNVEMFRQRKDVTYCGGDRSGGQMLCCCGSWVAMTFLSRTCCYC